MSKGVIPTPPPPPTVEYSPKNYRIKTEGSERYLVEERKSFLFISYWVRVDNIFSCKVSAEKYITLLREGGDGSLEAYTYY